jgi:uncharacterized membrane protein
MTVILALCAAMFYGVADYAGSRGARIAHAASITFLGQAVAFVFIGFFLLFAQTPVMPAESWMWTTGGGFGGAIALVAFYQAMSKGSMTVIAPITAVIGLSVPVLAGVLQGERPSSLAFQAQTPNYQPSSFTGTSMSSPSTPRTGRSTRLPARFATECCGVAVRST